jgi:hypothetical protein
MVGRDPENDGQNKDRVFPFRESIFELPGIEKY